ncbi:MAG: hypothetical protein V7K68_20645, partial [Nostoc sp.]
IVFANKITLYLNIIFSDRWFLTRPHKIALLPVRPMTKLEPQEHQEVWLKVVELAGKKVPTGRIVKDMVQRIE